MPCGGTERNGHKYEHPKLKTIWIARCGLGNLKLPEETQSLEEIIVKKNRLSKITLPKSLPKLEKLDISCNPIAELPKRIMPSLKKLNLSYTDFTS